MANKSTLLVEAKKVFDIEIEALNAVKESLNGDFSKIIDSIKECNGRIILTGMGKPGHIARKISATMASLGTSSFFLHPAEALHGDLGMIQSDDIVIAISYSGESEEVTRLIPNIKLIGATLICITGNKESTLAQNSDISYVFPKFREACYMNLAPTSSTTAALVFGDALAVCLSKEYGFDEKHYAVYHPAGSLGKKLLLRVDDLMHREEKNSVVLSGTFIKDAIVEMSNKSLGIINIVNKEYDLIGIFTDGDLRRTFSKNIDIYNRQIDEIMTTDPIFVGANLLAVEALNILKTKNITVLPVVENGKLIGTIRMIDIIKAGITI